MALSPQKFREIVLQLLYSQDMAKPDEDLMLELISTELEISKKNVKAAQERIRQIQEKLEEIDRLIASVSSSYDFDRIQKVTKNILRIGVFELYFDPSIPPKVAIAEAIRLSKKFNTPESVSFVNALLDHLYQMHSGIRPDPNSVRSGLQKLDESEQETARIVKQKLIESPSPVKTLFEEDLVPDD